MNANKDGLSAVDAATLSLSRCWYALARALRLNKLRDLLGSTISGLETPVTLLGRAYACSPGASESVQEEVRGELQRARQAPTPYQNGGAGAGGLLHPRPAPPAPPAPAP